MLNLILYTIEISFLCFILWYIYRFIRIPHCVKELYGQANYTFLTSFLGLRLLHAAAAIQEHFLYLVE